MYNDDYCLRLGTQFNIILGNTYNILRVNKRKVIVICAISILKHIIQTIENEDSEHLYSANKMKNVIVCIDKNMSYFQHVHFVDARKTNTDRYTQ